MSVNRLKHNDLRFPSVLANIAAPPAQLFWLGAHPDDFASLPKVAIVGSRKLSAYGRLVTEKFASELARSGIVIVSGLALGVDSVAHSACLAAGGLTIAVLPTSLEQIYPATHLNLAKQIVERGGCLLSEYAAGSEVRRTNFIARNRIVSGLADILLITEAAKDSGTMHTASFALEQGKTVMAVPGNINSVTSEGCNNLIKNGALPATAPEDVFAALGHKAKPTTKQIFRGSENERLIFELIDKGVSDLESLTNSSQLDPATLNSSLTVLEINGYIRAEAGNWFLK